MPSARKMLIAGKEYTGEEFKARLEENNWTAEDDETVIGALFESYMKAQEENSRVKTYETRSELKRGEELYTQLLESRLSPERQGKQKRELLREICKWENIDGEEKRAIDEYLNALAYTVVRERHEADREGFVESMQWAGWNRPGDKSFLEKLYDERIDRDGNINKEFDAFLSGLDREAGGLSGDREEIYKKIKTILEKIPEGERSTEQKELLATALAGRPGTE